MGKIHPAGRGTPSIPPTTGTKKQQKAVINIKDKVARTAHIRPPIPSVQTKPPSATKGLVKKIIKTFQRFQPLLAHKN